MNTMLNIGVIIISHAIIIGVMGYMINSINKRLDDLIKQIVNTNKRIAETNNRIDDTNDRIAETNDRIDDTNKRIAETNNRIDDSTKRTDDLRSEMKSDHETLANSVKELVAVVQGLTAVAQEIDKRVENLNQTMTRHLEFHAKDKT